MKINVLNCFFYPLFRLVEPSLSFFQFVPGFPYALCLFFYRVRGICRVQKGTAFLLALHMAVPCLTAVLCIYVLWLCRE